MIDNRPIIVFDADSWRAVQDIAGLLYRIPEIHQKDRRLFAADESGSFRPISFAKLRHYISSVSRIVNEKGEYIHIPAIITSGVMNLGVYPRVSYIHDNPETKEEIEKVSDVKSIPASCLESSILDGWAELPGSECGVSIPKAVSLLNDNPSKYQKLRDTLMGISRSKMDSLPPSPIIGKYFGKMKGVVFGNRYLEMLFKDGMGRVWAIRSVENAE